jgi:hypothetical protein
MMLGSMRRSAYAACFALACWSGQSHSARADISAHPCSRTTAGTTMSSLLIHGEIHKGDAAAFAKMVNELSKETHCPMLGSPPNGVPAIFVNLDSPGGDIAEALVIGREVRQRFLLTGVVKNMECDSACIFILIAGVQRVADGKIGLHRPAFDPEFFSGLPPQAARDRYTSMVEELRRYYVDEMGGSPEGFRLMMSIPSTEVHYASIKEMLDWGIIGDDPAWSEYNEAQFIKRLAASDGI